jgi:hypothetical protein
MMAAFEFLGESEAELDEEEAAELEPLRAQMRALRDSS